MTPSMLSGSEPPRIATFGARSMSWKVRREAPLASKSWDARPAIIPMEPATCTAYKIKLLR